MRSRRCRRAETFRSLRSQSRARRERGGRCPLRLRSDALYLVTIRDPKREQVYRVGTAWAAAKRTLVTSAGVIGAVEELRDVLPIATVNAPTLKKELEITEIEVHLTIFAGSRRGEDHPAGSGNAPPRSGTEQGPWANRRDHAKDRRGRGAAVSIPGATGVLRRRRHRSRRLQAYPRFYPSLPARPRSSGQDRRSCWRGSRFQ